MAKPIKKIGNWTDGSAAKQVEPDGAKKQTGWTENEAPAFENMNWLQYVFALWVDWLFGINVNQGTDDTSWDINGDTTLLNNGIKTMTNGCRYLTIPATWDSGSFINCESITTSYINSITDFSFVNCNSMSIYGTILTNVLVMHSNNMSIGEAGRTSHNVTVKNSSSGTAAGTDILVENCESYTVLGTNISIRNCKSIKYPVTISNSSGEHLDGFTESRDNTKTLTDLRLLGKHVSPPSNVIVRTQYLSRLGNAAQTMFGVGARYFVEKVNQSKAYYAEGTSWRDESLLGNNSGWAITGGTQSSDGVFSNSVYVTNDTTFIFQSGPWVEILNHTINFWVKIDDLDVSGNDNDGNIAYCGAGAAFGWELSEHSTPGDVNFGDFYFKPRVGDQICGILELPELKRNVFTMITVTLINGDWSIYINGKFAGRRTAGTQSVTQTTDFTLRSGSVGAGTSTIAMRIADVCYAEEVANPKEIAQMYCGGRLLTTDERSKIGQYTELKLLMLDSSSALAPADTPIYRGLMNDEFLAVEFPEYYRDDNYTLSAYYLSIYAINHAFEV